MPETVKHCPICSSPHSKPIDRRNFKGQQVDNRVCQDCGLVYQSPRMTSAELELFYQQEYRQLYQEQAGPGPKDLAIQGARAGSLLDFVQNNAGQSISIRYHLDVGCSAGLLLQRFQDTFQCQGTGIEPGTAYREYARQQGLTVFASLEELIGENTPPARLESHFDLISLAHVLEHLPQPLGYLANLRQNLLTPDGWLLVEVPNLYAHDCFEVAHLVSYSVHTLRQTLQQAGYTIHAVEEHGRPRSHSLPLYLTCLARPSSTPTGNLIPEKAVALKRRLGMLRRSFHERTSPRRAWLPIQG